ncbi:hypothetical protein ACHHYP_13279 [Achlya hypogyna]|uniref:Protein kinase domain-containing protein n=1 Tax=Achlya hypogyna TaxID=1202772 RepID=A0A1V9YFK2_ACHHY|nr:hypothetical protein ACHHYP_13279 [Achlya hypogyna]
MWCRDNTGAKLLLKGLEFRSASSVAKQGFVAGLQQVVGLHHDRLVRVLGASVVNHDATLVIAAEFAEKGSLGSILMDTKLLLTREDQLRLCRETAAGLAYVHAQKQIFGVLSSRKVLLDAAMGIKLNTLALMKPIYSDVRSPPKSFGSFAVATTAPELLAYDPTPTTASDIYSLGIVLGEVFTRRPPFEALYRERGYVAGDVELVRLLQKGHRLPFPFDEKALLAGSSADFVSLVKSCLQTDPSKRPDAATVQRRLGLLQL